MCVAHALAQPLRPTIHDTHINTTKHNLPCQVHDTTSDTHGKRARWPANTPRYCAPHPTAHLLRRAAARTSEHEIRASDYVVELGEAEWHIGRLQSLLDLLIGRSLRSPGEERCPRVHVWVAIGRRPSIRILEVQADARAAADVLGQGAVSYTHLTLPTTPYV